MVIAALIAFGLLAFFTLLPLTGLALGLPALSLIVSFVLIPLLDHWVGVRTTPTFGRLEAGFARWVPRMQVPLQAVLLAAAVLVAPRLQAGTLLVFAFAVGTVTGAMGITLAHEMGHRAAALDRWLARALLVSVAYGHFYVEHNRGHHARVATPEDPATAPRGMNVYRFLLRSIHGSFVHAWRLESLRLAQRGQGPWRPANWVLTGSLLSLALAAAAWLAAGMAGLVLFVIQAAWAVVLLEIVNYIEHYGLRRRRLGERYEPVQPHHSWNADFPVSNWMLFNLQLHSDHHAHVERPYETLRSWPRAPQLPAGYPTMVPVALVPPLWFALMDRRLPPDAGDLIAEAA
jgi:alkane 1-monooxygenase